MKYLVMLMILFPMVLVAQDPYEQQNKEMKEYLKDKQYSVHRRPSDGFKDKYCSSECRVNEICELYHDKYYCTEYHVFK